MKKYCIEHFPGTVAEYRIVKNPITGRWLPYDIYIPNLNGEEVFCEVMGHQHYRFIPPVHKTRDNYMRQVARDDYKEAYARAHGRYVEIDARKVARLEDAVAILTKNTRAGFIASMAQAIPFGEEHLADGIVRAYKETIGSPMGGMKNLTKSLEDQ